MSVSHWLSEKTYRLHCKWIIFERSVYDKWVEIMYPYTILDRSDRIKISKDMTFSDFYQSIDDWLAENCKGSWKHHFHRRRGPMYCFTRELDCVAFKVRWS